MPFNNIINVFQAMSIYSTVTSHNAQSVASQPDISAHDDPLVKINALTEKGSTMAGQSVIRDDDSLAEYFSDDEEREKALQAQKEKKEQHLQKLEKDT